MNKLSRAQFFARLKATATGLGRTDPLVAVEIAVSAMRQGLPVKDDRSFSDPIIKAVVSCASSRASAAQVLVDFETAWEYYDLLPVWKAESA